MACRVGITTDPDQRKTEWLREHPHLTNWRVMGPYSTREKAQHAESALAFQLNCDSSHGGNDPDDSSASWWLYTFDYDH